MEAGEALFRGFQPNSVRIDRNSWPPDQSILSFRAEAF